MRRAKIVDITHPGHSETLAKILLEGGVVGALWGHHLYFLACNACDPKAVSRMNKIKGRPKNQVLVSPGAVEEAEEFADIKKSVGLYYAALKMKMKPLRYLEFLFKKFPLGVELFAKSSAPSSVTFATKDGRTIWIAGHMGDKNYSKFLEAVRVLRKSGKRIVFAGTSLNLRGDNTLTVKQFDKVVKNFGDRLDAISTYPLKDKLKRVRYGTSCSVVSFTAKRPKILRVGCTSKATLKKYIPGLT